MTFRAQNQLAISLQRDLEGASSLACLLETRIIDFLLQSRRRPIELIYDFWQPTMKLEGVA